MPDTQLLQDLFNSGGKIQLDARTYEISSPLTVPLGQGLTISGAGMGLTNIRVTDAPSAIIAARDIPAACLTIQDLSIIPTGIHTGPGVKITSPVLFGSNRGGSSDFIAERIEIRGSGVATFDSGFYVDKQACPKFDKCWVQGRFGDITSEALMDPNAMKVAFNTAGSQEAKITNCFAGGARQGIYSSGNGPGNGEGIGILNNAIICCDDCIVLEGVPAGTYGGWATPWNAIAHNHLFYNKRAILGVARSDIGIGINSLCGSHLHRPTEEQVAIYLVDCENIRITGPSCWNPSVSGRPQGYGLVAVNTRGGSIVGMVTDASLRVGAWFVNNSTSWSGAGNTWRSTNATLNHAGQAFQLPVEAR